MRDTLHFRPKKSLGQNFLIDQNIKRKIIAACDLQKDETVLEIGPGKGVLTEAIAPCVKNLIAVEKDYLLAKDLATRFENTNVTIIENDFLEYDLNPLPENIKVIGNLPYNMATPIIEKIITNPQHFQSFYLTVQLEYGERIVAEPDTKAYGPLTCFVQYHAAAKKLFNIKNTAFYPQPKVNSCFLSLKINRTAKHNIADEKIFFRFIKQAFGQRRKTLVNALATQYGKSNAAEALTQLGIQSNVRAENLSLENFIQLFGQLHK